VRRVDRALQRELDGGRAAIHLDAEDVLGRDERPRIVAAEQEYFCTTSR
jgi:hypothetical protein